MVMESCRRVKFAARLAYKVEVESKISCYHKVQNPKPMWDKLFVFFQYFRILQLL